MQFGLECRHLSGVLGRLFEEIAGEPIVERAQT